MADPEPFSCKMVTRSDANYSLAMEASSLVAFPSFPERQHAQDITMLDKRNNERVFRLRVRRGIYKKPVLSRGWREFVRDENVEAGFMVGFFREIDGVTGEIRFKIKVAPPVRLFGAVIGHAPFPRGG